MSSMSKSIRNIEIFFAYAHNDKRLRDQLAKHLSTLEQQELISCWYDHKIQGGEVWENEIDKHLNSAHIILLLVSPDFIASRYCYTIEMKRALERYKAGEAHVIPVILRPSDWQETPLGQLQALPEDGKPVTSWKNRDEAFLSITRGIRKIAELLSIESRSRLFQDHREGENFSFPIVGVLPPTDSKFIQQRDKVVKDIYEKLTQPAITAVALTGIGGIGKSTLAALVFHYAQEQFHLGQELFAAEAFWLTVNESDSLTELARMLFDVFGKPLPRLENLHSQNLAIALFNTLNTPGKARLVILDQFERLLDKQTGQVRTDRLGIGEWINIINNQPCISRILLTSRLWPQGIQIFPRIHMQDYPVTGLEVTEGIELLRSQGIEATQATEIELRSTVERYKGHALALSVLSARLSADPSLKLSSILNKPTYTSFRIKNIASEVIGYSFKQLSKEQGKLLSAFSIYREAVSVEAVTDLLPEVSEMQIPLELYVLVTQRLLQAVGEEKYQVHPVIAEYAVGQFDETSENGNRQALQMAHVTAAQYYAAHFPTQGQRQAVSDLKPFIEAIWHYCQAEQWEEAYKITEQEGIYGDLRRWGLNTTLLDLCELLFPLEKWHPEPERQATILDNLGQACDDLGQKNNALKYYEEALRLYSRLGSYEKEGVMLSKIGFIHAVSGNEKEARKYYEKSLDVFKQVRQSSSEEGEVLNKLGEIYNALRQRSKAQECYEEAMRIFKEVGDLIGEGVALNNLGQLYEYPDLYEDQWLVTPVVDIAIKYYEEALSIFRKQKDLSKEGRTLSNLAVVYSRQGKKILASKYYKDALHIYTEIGNQWEMGRVLSHLGTIYSDIGEHKRSLKYYKQALHICREIKDLWGEGKVVFNVGILYFVQEHFDIALACYLLSKDFFESANASSSLDEVLIMMNTLHQRVGEEKFIVLSAIAKRHIHTVVEQALLGSRFDHITPKNILVTSADENHTSADENSQ